jgi:hypothetical protein
MFDPREVADDGGADVSLAPLSPKPRSVISRERGRIAGPNLFFWKVSVRIPAASTERCACASTSCWRSRVPAKIPDFVTRPTRSTASPRRASATNAATAWARESTARPSRKDWRLSWTRTSTSVFTHTSAIAFGSGQGNALEELKKRFTKAMFVAKDKATSAAAPLDASAAPEDAPQNALQSSAPRS